MSTSEAPTKSLELDVRPVLAQGGEPLEMILAAASRVAAGGTLLLTAPFEPVPLYRVLAARGFVRETEQLGPAEWRIRFRHTGITEQATVAEIFERFPSTGPVLAEFGLDLCCGGARTLQTVAEVHRLPLAELLGRLRAAAME